jgi:hypothetical protein
MKRDPITSVFSWGLAGVLLGSSIILFSVLEYRESDSISAIVVVNGSPITSETVEFARRKVLKNDSSQTIGAFSSETLLDILIDQELLLQQALRIRLLYHDRRLRNMAVRAALDSVVSDEPQEVPQNIPTDYSDYVDRERRKNSRLDRYFGDFTERKDVRLSDEALRILRYENSAQTKGVL